MSLLKYALIGAAVAYGINYIARKREDGTSILDEMTENAPEWFEKAKRTVEDTINHITENIKENNASHTETQV